MKYLLCLFTFFSLTACQVGVNSSKKNQEVTEVDVLHHRYKLVRMNDTVFDSSIVGSELSFNESMNILGKACNRFMGKGSIKNGVLFVFNIASTRMFCVEPELNTLEKVLFSMLEKGAKISIDDDSLILSNESDKLTYKRKDLVN